MKQIIFFLLLAVGLSAQNNIVSNGPTSFVWINGAPTFTPSSSGVKLAIDRNTFKRYSFNGTSWLWDGDRIQRISGCSAPNYVPAKAQSRIVINGCEGEFVPEIYLYVGPTASDWTLLNEPGIDSLKNMSDVTITSPANGQVLSYSSGDWVNSTLPDASATNELQTLSSGTNTVTLSNSGGTVTVDTDPTNDITLLSGGTGVSVSGSGNSRTITNTGDLSNTNELQTISISGSDIMLSNGGGTVTVPGGSVTFPLLAPYSEDAPVYSFSNKTDAGIYRNGSGITITEGIEFGGDAKGVYISGGVGTYSGGPVVLSGGSSSGPGGSIGINAGNSFSANGGSFGINGGGSVNGNGGDMTALAGSSDNASGGGFSFYAGNGAVSGGSYSMQSGTGVTGDGGFFALVAGASTDANGGRVGIETGGSTNGNGGNVEFTVGGSENGAAGAFVVTTGSSPSGGGRIIFSTGIDGAFNQQIAEFYVAGILLGPITEAQRDAITLIQTGLRVYCIDCTANDSSTGVEQTYNGSIWKNLW